MFNEFHTDSKFNSSPESDFESLFRHNPNPVFALDLNGNFIKANEAAIKFSGLSLQELAGMHYSVFLNKEDLEYIQEHFTEAREGVSFNFEMGVNIPGRGRKYLNITNMPLVVNGEIAGIFCLGHDVTERKFIDLENALASRIGRVFSSEKGFKESLYLTLDEICNFTTTAVSQIWSPNMIKKELNLNAQYVCGEDFQLCDGKIHIDHTSEPAGRAMVLRRPVYVEDIQNSKHFYDRDFSLKHRIQNALAIPIFYLDDVVSVVVFYNLKPEDQLRILHLNYNLFKQLGGFIYRKETVEHLQRLFSLSSDLLFIACRNGYFKKVNAAFEQTLGYSTDHLLSLPYYQFIHEEDISFTRSRIESLSSSSPTVNFENRMVTKDGNTRWFAWTITLMISEDLLYGVVRDITQAKKLEMTIRREKERFSAMYNEAPVTMAILKGREHVFESVNELYYKFSGRRNIIGKTVREVFPEAGRQGIFEIMDEVYQYGETYSVNERHLQLDVDGSGKLQDFYLSFMFQPFRNQEGQVEGIFYFGVDVSEQVKARRRIEESHKQYLELIQNLPAAVYTCNYKGEILLYNRAAVELWGRKPELGHDKWCGSWEIFNKEGQRIPHEFSPMAITLREGRSQPHKEFIIKRPDQHFRNVVTFPSPVFDTEGNLSGGINVLIDITERKKSEEQLKLLSLIAQKTINAVIITNANGRIEWVNEAFTEITGYSIEEIIDEKFSILYGLATDRGTIKFVEERISKKKAFECEMLKYSKTGNPFWVRIEGQPLKDENGNFQHYFQIETDITERKIAFEQLVKTENQIRTFARELNQMLEEERSKIAREIHDEFGQQLMGLKMSLSSLKKLVKKGSRSFHIVTGVLLDTENSIKSLRKISTELRPGILDTLGLIPSIEWLAGEFEKRTGIHCRIKKNISNQEFDKELSIVFFRVCQEALTNVSKHSGASTVDIELIQTPLLFSMKISDNGKGIHHEKIEDPFSMGLIGMKERAKLIGADLKIIDEQPGTSIQLIYKQNV